jgi:tetratricopeptide (TPR) repeat protein
MENISVQDTDLNALLSSAYELTGGRNLDEAVRRIEGALGLHFNNQEVEAFLRCAKYWQDRFVNIAGYSSEFEKAEYLLEQWRGFADFAARMGQAPQRCEAAFKALVLRSALAMYESLLDTPAAGTRDGDLLMRIGRCYKGLGEYDKALQYLDAANQIKKENAEILAELADCYSLVGEDRISRAFFREAFFIDPEAVDIEGIESVMIRRLVDKLRGMGMRGPQLAQWLPVYGVLFDVLNVKRELRPIEYGRLRQSIYTMEMEMRENPGKKEAGLARLINRYFWLIDHYRMTKESREKIDEVMLKIRELSPALYNEYTK